MIDDLDATIRVMRRLLGSFTFVAASEAALHRMIIQCLRDADWEASSEVRSHAGRYDIVVVSGGLRIVLELKLHAPTSQVERQAQRYALEPDVSAVGVVTTSRRLAHGLGNPGTLGGKPFFVISLRTT